MIEFTTAHRIGSGAFGHIFAPPPGERAYKLFRRIEDPDLSHVPPLVFSAETAALEIASKHPLLASHSPAYYGRVEVVRVLGDSGEDISSKYWLSLCYCMERFPPDPDERKFGSFFSPEEWHLMEYLDRAFEEAGIRHLGDASVLHWRTGQPVIIDFAISDAAADHMRLPNAEY